MSDDNLIKVLNDAGFNTVEGKSDLLKAIEDMGSDSTVLLCSGYGVFPNGNKCTGCADCQTIG